MLLALCGVWTIRCGVLSILYGCCVLWNVWVRCMEYEEYGLCGLMNGVLYELCGI